MSIEILGVTIHAAIVWLALAAIFGFIEALTMGLTTIWFTGGAIVAAITAMSGFSTTVQVVVFFVVSILLIIFTRPLAKKKLKVGAEKTNVEALAGREALVVKTIEPFCPGQAKVDGVVWTAVAENQESTFEKGAAVRIHRIEGVKLVVAPLQS